MIWIWILIIAQAVINMHVYSCLMNHRDAIQEDRRKIALVRLWIDRGDS